MRKLTIVIAVLLIATALLGPGLTGRLAERVVNDNRDALAASLPDGLMLVEQRFERGWFTSTSRYRVVLTQPERAAALARLLGVGEFADEPAILVNSLVRHGPLVGLFTPALARVESRFAADDGDALRGLPVSLTATLGLTGNSRFEWTVSEGGVTGVRRGLRWDTFRLTQRVNNALNRLSFDVAMPVLDIVDNAGQSALRIADIALESVTTRAGGTLSVDADYEALRPADGALPETRISGSLAIEGLAEQATGSLLVLRELLSSAITGMPPANPVALSPLISLLGDGVSVAWKLQLDTDSGRLALDVDLALPGADVAADMPLQAALAEIGQAADARISLRLSPAYAEQLSAGSQQLQQQLTMLRGTGFLQPDANDGMLTMQVDYSDGLLIVNGLPVPLSAASVAP